MARPERFERPTPEVEAPCSIQLSYERIIWCEWPESNWHNLRRQILSLLCLPISPHSHYFLIFFTSPVYQIGIYHHGCFLGLTKVNSHSSPLGSIHVLCQPHHVLLLRQVIRPPTVMRCFTTQIKQLPIRVFILSLAESELHLKMAEDVGVEPTQQFNPLYGLAIRCLTVRPVFLIRQTQGGVLVMFHATLLRVLVYDN